MSFGAWCFKYNARCTARGDTRSELVARMIYVTFARKVRMMNWWPPRDGDFVATRRHCFLRIGIHLVTGRYCLDRRMDVTEVIIGRTGDSKILSEKSRWIIHFLGRWVPPRTLEKIRTTGIIYFIILIYYSCFMHSFYYGNFGEILGRCDDLFSPYSKKHWRNCN